MTYYGLFWQRIKFLNELKPLTTANAVFTDSTDGMKQVTLTLNGLFSTSSIW